MADLSVDLAGVRLRNPFLLASGIWGESGDSLGGAWKAGAGGVITKSIGRLPRPGYPNPTIESLERWGFLNAMGLPNPGIEEYPKEIETARATGATVIGSVFGADAAEFVDVAERMERTGVVALELNLSCPHTEGLGSEIGQDPAEVEAITRAVRERVRVPVIVKITPNTADPVGLARAAERGGAAAISAINTVRALAIDVHLRRPTLSHGLGGLSGPAIKPIGLACVWQIREALTIPIVGVGGVMTAEDALEYVMAGACAVEVGTAVAFEGIGVFGRLVESLGRLLDELGFESVRSAQGAAHGSEARAPMPARRRRPPRSR
ncbi:MAG: dihydroorotate dehydrogenase [Thermoplasmata archaeon]|nr:dihydroorotate dehydrogenase [Thermoplasmata archaeon]